MASDDPQTLRDQYARIKFVPNVGIALGKQSDGSYLVCIDVDDPERMAALEDELGVLPATLTGYSPRGARHFLKAPAGAPIERLKNVTGIGGVPGVDLKASGGQVVVLGRNARGPYRMDEPRAPIAELPAAWLLALLEPARPPEAAHEYTPKTLRDDARARKKFEKYLENAVRGEAHLIARCGEGARNTALHRSACSLFALANGLHLPSGWGYVRSELESAGCASGLSEGEVRATVASAERWVVDSGAVRMPREAPAPPPTPSPGGAEHAEGDAYDVPPPVSRSGGGGGGGSIGVDLVEDNGSPARTAGNVARMLAIYSKGQPRLDVFANKMIWPDGTLIADVDALELIDWLTAQPSNIRVRVGLDVAFGGLTLAASRNTFHPILDYLGGLTWDKVPRVDAFCSRYMGAVDSNYIRGVSSCFLIGAVARVKIPGCKLDTMPVFEGKQGQRKSSALKILAGECWFSDTPIDLSSKDRFQALDGVWIHEYGEFEAFTRAEQAKLKAYVSSSEDHYRVPHGRIPIRKLRSTAFAGTTNSEDYLSDPTGGRRWHPVVCGEIDLAALAHDRDQLWAEATIRHAAGERWWLPEVLDVVAAEVVESRYQIDPWEDMLAHKLLDLSVVTSSQALTLLHVELGKQSRGDAMRVAAILKRAGWRKRPFKREGTRGFEFFRQ